MVGRRVRPLDRALVGIRSRGGRIPDGELGSLDPGMGRELHAGRGRDQSVHGAAHHLYHPDRHPGIVQLHLQAGAGVLRPHAPARDRNPGCVSLPGPLPLLRVLRAHARPDVLHRGSLGWRASHLRRGQVLPLHGVRLAAHAGSRSLPVLPQPGVAGSGDIRIRRPARGDAHAQGTALVVRSVRARILDQGSRFPRSTPGCRTPTWRRPRPARSSWPRCC